MEIITLDTISRTDLAAYLITPAAVMQGYNLTSMLKSWGIIFHNRNKFRIIERNAIKADPLQVQVTIKEFWLLAYLMCSIIYFLGFTQFWWAAYWFTRDLYLSEGRFYYFLLANFIQCSIGIILFPDRQKLDISRIRRTLERNKYALYILIILFVLSTQGLNEGMHEGGLTNLKETTMRLLPILIVGIVFLVEDRWLGKKTKSLVRKIEHCDRMRILIPQRKKLSITVWARIIINAIFLISLAALLVIFAYIRQYDYKDKVTQNPYWRGCSERHHTGADVRRASVSFKSPSLRPVFKV